MMASEVCLGVSTCRHRHDTTRVLTSTQDTLNDEELRPHFRALPMSPGTQQTK